MIKRIMEKQAEKTLQVLLVEDSASDVALLLEEIHAAEVRDIALSTAESLREALECLKSNHIDTVLLDLTLPDSHGLDTVRRIRQDDPHVPIVVLTGVADEETGVEALRIGVQDYLVKGQADGRIIIRAVRHAIERRKIEEALRTAEELARHRLAEIEDLYHNAPIGLCALDRDLRFLRINERLAVINGIPAADHIGKRVRDLMPQLADAVEPEMRRVLESGQPRLNIEIVSETPARPGVKRSWVQQWLPVTDERGRVVGLSIVVEETTERKQAEEALRVANERYELVLAGAEAGIWDWDVPGHRVAYSSRWKELRGFTDDQITDAEAEWSSRIHPDDISRVMAAVEAHFQGKTPVFAQEYRVKRKDGSWIWIADHGIARRDANGQVVRMAGSETDITERRQAEEALRESEQRMQQALSVSHSFAFEWEPASDRVVRSRSCETILKLSGDEAVNDTGQRYFQRVDADDRDKFVHLVQGLTPAAATYTVEYRVVCGDNSLAVLEETGQGSFDPAGKLERVVGVATDITARKQAEQELGRARNTLAEAQRIAHLGSFEYIAATRTTEWSEEEYRIYGLNPAEPSPQYDVMLEKCIHPDDAALLRETFTKAMQSRSVYELEHRIVRPDGSVRWVYDLAYPDVDENGNLLRYVGATLDITERKAAEQALRENNEELSRFNRAAVGRELRMIELKKEVNDLCEQAGKPPRYPLKCEKENEDEKRRTSTA